MEGIRHATKWLWNKKLKDRCQEGMGYRPQDFQQQWQSKVWVIGNTSSSSLTSTVNTSQGNSSGHKARIVTSRQRPVWTEGQGLDLRLPLPQDHDVTKQAPLPTLMHQMTTQGVSEKKLTRPKENLLKVMKKETEWPGMQWKLKKIINEVGCCFRFGKVGFFLICFWVWGAHILVEVYKLVKSYTKNFWEIS